MSMMTYFLNIKISHHRHRTILEILFQLNFCDQGNFSNALKNNQNESKRI